MELHAVGVAAFEDCSVWRGVGTSGRGLRSHRDVVAVGEIDVRVHGHSGEQLHRPVWLQRIPTHVRHARVPGEALHRARIDAQAAHLGSFFTVFEESLQAETDAEERHARLDALDERGADIHLVERAQHLAEVANTGQDDLAGKRDSGGIVYQLFCTERKLPAP